MNSPTESPSPFTDHDLEQIQSAGLNVEEILQQIARFAMGFSPLKLIRPVDYQDGVLKLTEGPVAERYIALYEQAAEEKKLCKFVPASGAASRMFRSLFAYLDACRKGNKEMNAELSSFFQNLDKFAFYPDLEAALKQAGLEIGQLLDQKDHVPILEYLLNEKGLNYGNLPKALLPFHRYKDHSRTALEEHLVEGAHYCRSGDKQVNLHFTVSEEHQGLVKKHIQKVHPGYEQQLNCHFYIETSIQHPSTDTIAVDLENRPFRDARGRLLFRPGGHGALLENLNQLDADLVFIKNIDNVVPDSLKASTYYWKKVIGGVLVQVQQKSFDWLRRMDDWETWPDEEQERQLVHFLKTSLNTGLRPDYPRLTPGERLTYLRGLLNRPIRVLGIIRTDTETGGGPFWVENPDGSQSLQIIETAQINLKDSKQQAIASRSRFANITDLVCGVKDYRGNHFDLLQFRDEETGFISQKSQNGRDLKALEHPGLWNGAMAHWNTLLVEVPVATFNPVKSVMDLLGEGHVG